MMADDDNEDAPSKDDDDNGPKIKMGRIGKKKKSKGAKAEPESQSYTKQIGGASAPVAPKPTTVGGGFSENDIEFMKKAIQILC